MATGFSPQMYSEGNVLFDSTPSIRLAEQIANRKMAKEEALDKYFNDLNKSFNPAGMRNQDTAGFMQKTNELRDFYAKNKDAIRNPKNDLSKAYNEYYSRYQDALNYINQSKQEGDKVKSIAGILADPTKRSLIPESVINSLAKHDLSLTDPNRISFNPATINFNPKPFGIKEQQAYLKGAQEGIKMIPSISVGPTDPKTFQQTVTTTEAFDEQGKNAIGQRAAAAYNSDPSFKKLIDDIATNPQQADMLNKMFINDFGRGIESLEDLASAWTFANIQKERQTQKNQDDWLSKQRFLQNQRLDLMNRRAAQQTQQDKNSWVLDVIDNITEEALSSADPLHEAGFSLTKTNEIPLTGFLATALSRDKQEPDALRILSNGKYYPIFYQRDKDGVIKRNDKGTAIINETLSVPMSKENLALQLGYKGQTKKELGGTVKEAINKPTSNSYRVNGQPYSHDQLIKMGYTENEIKEAIKAGLIQR